MEKEESFSRQKTSQLRDKGKVEVMDKTCWCSSNKDHTLLSVTVCYHGEISTKLLGQGYAKIQGRPNVRLLSQIVVMICILPAVGESSHTAPHLRQHLVLFNP